MANKAPFVNAIHPDILPRLDPQFTAIYNKYQAPRIRADQVSFQEYDADRAKYTFPIASGPAPEVASVKVYVVKVANPDGDIKVQVFTPTETAIEAAGSKNVDGLLPAHVEYHGGGFVIGSLTSDEPWCRQICQAVGAVVVNVDYRMAPLYPHPVPINDSWTALKWVFSNAPSLGVDTSRISVGGGSAGANLAAVLALLARDEPGMPKLVLQMLVVPLVDVRNFPIEGPCDPIKTPYESLVSLEFAPCLPLQRLQWFYNLWLGTDIEEREQKANTFLASPIIADSHANLAPASFHIAEIDPLYSEGLAYHHVLAKAETTSKFTIYKGVAHPFGHWDGELEAAKSYVKNTISALKEAYGLSGSIGDGAEVIPSIDQYIA